MQPQTTDPVPSTVPSGRWLGPGVHDAGSAATVAAATRSQLGGALLAYMLGVTLIITLVPFQFVMPDHWRVMTTGGALDIVANVVLFVPLGFCFRLAQRNAGRHSGLRVLAVGLLLSMAIESLQLFEPERYTSLVDVITNALGAGIGGALCGRFAGDARVDERFARRLFLELPLMGLVYLLLPLLWLNSLAAVSEPWRAWLGVPLVAFGAFVLGGVQREQLGASGRLSARTTALCAGVGSAFGMFPALGTTPMAIGVCGVLGMGLTWVIGTSPGGYPASRRFEIPVLKESAPAFAVFVVLLTLAPVLFSVGHSNALAGSGAPSRGEIIVLLEVLASYSIMGYMLAEFQGRSERSGAAETVRLVVWGSALSIIAELIPAGGQFQDFSGARVLLSVLAALYGGWLYVLQRAHVVALLAATGRQAPIIVGASPRARAHGQTALTIARGSGSPEETSLP